MKMWLLYGIISHSCRIKRERPCRVWEKSWSVRSLRRMYVNKLQYHLFEYIAHLVARNKVAKERREKHLYKLFA